jgi:DNA-binding winged helix-turn-helix (wHTH) protein
MAHCDRSVDVFIRKLRQKLERRSPDWSYIHTHFGVGYRFDPESALALPEPVAVEAAPQVPADPEPAAASQAVHKTFTAA